MNIGQRVELLESGGSIPGVPPGVYYIVARDINGRVAISSTPTGEPLVPTGQPIGTPSFRVIDDFDYAFPLEGSIWLELSLEEFLETNLTEYLTLELM